MKRPFLLTSLLLFLGCSSVDPALLDDDNKTHVKDLPPVPYRIAIGPVQGVPTGGAAEGLSITASADRIQEDLRAHLNAFQTAGADVSVVNASFDPRAANASDTADLYIRPKVTTTAAPRPLGRSDQWLAAGGFWLLSWIGGLFVDDYSYDTAFELTCDITSCFEGTPLTTAACQGGRIDLEYWDRNTFPSLRMLESFVLPPFWTSDDQETTSASLTDRAIRAAAGRLSLFLKKDLEGKVQDGFGRLRLMSPATAEATIEGAFPLRFEIVSRAAVSGVAVWVDGELVDPPPSFEPGTPGSGGLYTCQVAQPIAANPGLASRTIRIQTALANGARIGRTLVVHTRRASTTDA
jgi:hypothetical protein